MGRGMPLSVITGLSALVILLSVSSPACTGTLNIGVAEEDPNIDDGDATLAGPDAGTIPDQLTVNGEDRHGHEADFGSPSSDADVIDTAVTPDTLAPDTLAPDTLTPDTLAPDTLAPDTLAPDTLAPDHAVPLPDVHVRPDHPATSSCKVTLCMAGAVKLTDGWNPLLADLCKDLPGIIMNGSSPLFRMDQSTAALDRAIAALDTSGNGSVDSNDKQCEFRIVGYSWGGINANGIARDFLKDYRVSLSRRVVHKLIVIDPYRPGTSIKVPFGVVDFWEYRHTKSPSKDCSRNDWGGPYKGIRPKCQATVRCRDYDFSLAPYEKFGSYSGSQVGHCTVINAAYWAVIHNLKWGKDYFRVPPKVPIVTFN